MATTEKTFVVNTKVVAVIPEFKQVKVEDSDGRIYAITHLTSGVDLTALRHNQKVQCTVSDNFRIVLEASISG